MSAPDDPTDTSDPQRANRHLLKHLRDVIADTGFTHRELEARTGLSRGYLSQLFANNITLKVSHVLLVLDALEIDPGSFFAALYPPPRWVSGVRLPADHDLASVYGFGIEALARVRQRLERCEGALCDLHDTGVFTDEEATDDALREPV